MRSRLIVGASSAIALLFSIASSALPVSAANSVGRIVEKQGEVALKRVSALSDQSIKAQSFIPEIC